MKELFCCMKKDLLEFMRAKRNLFFMGVLVGLAIMVLSMTQSFPFLIEELMKKKPDFISDPDSIHQMLAKLFPQDVKANLGIWSSDVGIFYTIVTVLTVYNILPNEIQEGKWIFPIAVGYKNEVLILSKSLVYSVGAAFPVMVIYNLYYMISSYMLLDNYTMKSAMFNSVILGISIFSIVNITIMASLIYKHAIINAVSMIVMIMAFPDIMTMFSFGKFFPTYLLTYVYSSREEWMSVIIPMIILVILQLIIAKFAIKKSYMIEIAR